MTTNFHIPLAAEQQAVAVDLQGTLVDLLDLTLIGKHLHWNVEGRHFRVRAPPARRASRGVAQAFGRSWPSAP